MKKSLSILLAVLFAATMSFAQDGKKSLKMASKSLSNYSKNPFGNGASLDEAKAHLEAAFQDEKISSQPKSWLTRGEIFFNIGDGQIKQKLLNPEFKVTEPNAGIEAFNSYKKVLEIAEKKGEKKNAIKGIVQVSGLLNSLGVDQYQAENYAISHDNFMGEIEAGFLLVENGEKSDVQDESILTNKYYFAGITAHYSEKYPAAKEMLVKAIETGTSESTIYQLLYETFAKLDMTEEGLPYLVEGREKFPDDSGLLFSEINYYLVAGKLDEMISKLEIALEKEPNNSSVIQTMGQVYDQLQTKSIEAGDTEKATYYYEKAKSFYADAVANDPSNFDLQYSLGALYYNKAAQLTPALNEVANDFTPAGSKKYDAIKAEMAGLFGEALPYFVLADQLKENDRNTIIALKEIYARQDNFEKSNEYKAKLEALVDQN